MLAKMTEDLKCCIFYSFLKFTGLCVKTPGSWVQITTDIVGGAFESDKGAAGRSPESDGRD